LLWQKRIAHPMRYPERQFGQVWLLTYLLTPNAQWKICVPMQQLCNLMQWYHQALSHCGLHHLLRTIMMHLHHPKNMQTIAEDITRNCDACQRQKLPGPQYAHLPPQEAALVPWEEAVLDLISPCDNQTIRNGGTEKGHLFLSQNPSFLGSSGGPLRIWKKY
jgi:hypothetical protein